MKTIQHLLMISGIVTAILVIAGCRSGRELYNEPPPPPRVYANFSLIISPTPGFVISRYPDGRYYHRSPQGYIYWRGYDNRFYLDRSYIRRVNYTHREYNQWMKYNNRHNRKRRY
jgi:hypothetical protein